ncbi:thyroid receptor-interacting protein 6 [Esox lucius]|uniref:LIM zinc-binding domain-containing protein n=1 Tax=Esox lucius TaxID=8010 RepID=A0A3P8YTW3_ESOLU|nr:thyroid receptor-interacting protein 6 [Esox lucius]
MSGPTWLPPRTLGSPERAVTQMSHSGPAIYRPSPKNVPSDPRSKYGVYEQNGGGAVMATRFIATGPTGGPIQHQEDPGFHQKPNDHYYQPPPPHGSKEERPWNAHMDSYELMHRGPPENPGGPHSNIDAEIDSLTTMLADLDSQPENCAQLYDNVPYNQPISVDRNRPPAPAGAASQSRPFMGYPPQSQYHSAPRYPSDAYQGPLYSPQPESTYAQVSKAYPPPESTYAQVSKAYPPPESTYAQVSKAYPPSDSNYAQVSKAYPPSDSNYAQVSKAYPPPNSNYAQVSKAYPPPNSNYTQVSKAYPPPNSNYAQVPKAYPQPDTTYAQVSKLHPQPDNTYAQVSKPYPQPVPASYTTASTPTGPRFSVQVKTAQPVTYSQTGRQAEQAYTPPTPRQHASRPLPQNQADPQCWYPPHNMSQAQETHSEVGYKGGATGSGGRVSQGPMPKRGQEIHQSGSGLAPNSAYQPGKQGSVGPRQEEELDRLTKKLVYDMNHPPTEEYFGRCARCGDNVLGDGSGCIAMEQVFHVECFTCITCHARLRGQPFYALDKKSYCESCYISTLERCSKCSKPILDRILRAMGKAYHPRCFTCVVCDCCLDGVPFTVDATSQIHCIDDFHRKFAPRCSVCGQAIMPEPGQEETVRIVALDRSFHVNCYVCEECGLLLSSEGEGRGCYPLDGHILCKGCSARRIQDLSAKISTDC